jgi:hypothetical protein
MYRRTHVDVVELTPDLVRWFRMFAIWIGDRSALTAVGRSRVARLKQLNADRLFYGVSWVLATLDGVVYRINGNRSSTMLTELTPEEFPLGLLAIIEHFTCESRLDLIQLYSQFDSLWSARSQCDSARSQRELAPELHDISAGALIAAACGAVCALSGVIRSRITSPDERLLLMHEYPAFMAWAGRLTSNRKFRSVGVVAAMFDMYQRSPRMACEFWGLVADRALQQTTATTVLENFLQSITVPHYRGRKWDFRACYCKSIIAANAWYAGASTHLHYVPDAPLTPLRWPQE